MENVFFRSRSRKAVSADSKSYISGKVSKFIIKGQKS